MSSSDAPLKNMPQPKTRQHRISLVAGIILIVGTLLVGVTVFIVMQRNAEELLSKSLQVSLQNREQQLQAGIETGFERIRGISTRPLLIDQVQLVNAGADEEAARIRLHTAVQSFLLTGIKAVTLLDKDGRELAQAGSFTQKPALTVPLNLPGRVQLIWDGQLLLHAVVDIKQAGQVVGQVVAETVLPITTNALKEAHLLGATGELALCASFGLNMQCFPTARNATILTLPKRSPQGVPLPMAHALEGGTGFITALDYRKQKVVAAYAPVGDLGLGLVLKMDRAELYAPVWEQLRYLIPLLAGVLVIALLSLRWLLSPLVFRLVRSEAEAQEMSASLHASELQLRQITDAVPALIADLDIEQRFLFHNKAYEEVFGLSFEQINGHTLAEVLGQPAYEPVQGKVEEVLRGYAVRYECIQNTPQGEGRNYAIQYFPRYGEGADEGKTIGFFSLGTDITELKRIDRMKTEFISTVSHELRTPLTSIRGSLGLIDGGVAGEVPKAVKNLVGIAKNNCERLIRLINDILDSEKIESGKMHLDLQVADIKLLVQQALVSNQGFASQYRVSLLLQAPDELLQVRIDRDRMIQVLTNLLSNAVKFSPPESAVEVKVSRVAQGVRVEVADHGPGIPENFRGRIFQKFSQADSSDTRQKGGSGLGLNIAKALIEKMGGQIGFSSEAGAGTTFFLELPEWQNPAPLQAVPTQAVFSRPRILVSEGDADVASLESGKPRILHVEDEPDIQHIVAAIVQDFASIEYATTLDAARARLRERRFDLVLLDLALGEDSGWDLFADIDALDPRPPVIVFTVNDVDTAEGKQVEAILVKASTSNTELSNTIRRVLQIPGDPGPTRPQPLS